MVGRSKLPHLGSRLAEDTIGANEYVSAKRRAIGADCSNAGSLMLDVGKVLVDENLALILQVFIQHLQQVLPFAPGSRIPRSIKQRP